MHVQLTPGFDVALLVFDTFVLFFIGLVFYLRREDRREGYPLEDDLTGQIFNAGGPLAHARPKTFHLPFGRGAVTTPTGPRDRFDVPGRPVERAHGAPLAPTGNPLVDGIGPASWANRAKHPDLDMDGHPRIVPISGATGYTVARNDPGLVGWTVLGADKKVAGTVEELWIDRADRLVRYLQVRLPSGGAVLAPMMMSRVDRRRRAVIVDAILAAQFDEAPAVPAGGVITLYEEERAQAYFGGGYLYATKARAEPLI